MKKDFWEMNRYWKFAYWVNANYWFITSLMLLFFNLILCVLVFYMMGLCPSNTGARWYTTDDGRICGMQRNKCIRTGLVVKDVSPEYPTGVIRIKYE